MGFPIFSLLLMLAMPTGELDDLPNLKGGIHRISSYDRLEGDVDFFDVLPGQSLVMADFEGPATIKRIYIKVDSNDPAHLRTMVLRFFWNDEDVASVDCPLGDFFGLGHAQYYPVQSIPLVTGNRRGMTCYFPMPFSKKAVLILVNEGSGSRNRVYYQIDYESGAPEDAGLFHAIYRQGVVTAGDVNFQVLHAEGAGKYVGMVLSMVLGEDGWFGEGDERIYVDGSKAPSVQGTGLDDLFGCAWGFENGFSGPYAGTPVAGDWTKGSEFVGYRFHLRDPITFTKSIDIYLEHVGERYSDDRLMGTSMSRRDEFYSVAYWYQTPPTSAFIPVPTVDLRISGDRRFTAEGELLLVDPKIESQVKVVQVEGVTAMRFTPKEVGDEVVFSIQHGRTGWVDLSGYFTRSARHGAYRVRLADKIVGDSIDFFKDEGGSGRFHTQRSDEIYIGSLLLTPGAHKLCFEALEANEKAVGMLLDIDALIFRPRPPPEKE